MPDSTEATSPNTKHPAANQQPPNIGATYLFGITKEKTDSTVKERLGEKEDGTDRMMKS